MTIELTRTELRILINALATQGNKLQALKMQNLVTDSEVTELWALQGKIVTSYEGVIRRGKKVVSR